MKDNRLLFFLNMRNKSEELNNNIDRTKVYAFNSNP